MLGARWYGGEEARGTSSAMRSFVALERASLPWRWGTRSAMPGSTEPSGEMEESRSTVERKEVRYADSDGEKRAMVGFRKSVSYPTSKACDIFPHPPQRSALAALLALLLRPFNCSHA